MGSNTSPPLLQRLADSVAACFDVPTLQALATLELDTDTRARLDQLAEKANEGRGDRVCSAEQRHRFLAVVTVNEVGEGGEQPAMVEHVQDLAEASESWLCEPSRHS